jgi:hypothetical protein
MINADLVGPFKGIDHWKIEGAGKDPEFVKLTPDLPNREILPFRDVYVAFQHCDTPHFKLEISLRCYVDAGGSLRTLTSESLSLLNILDGKRS